MCRPLPRAAHVGGDALALQEDLDGAQRSADFDLAAGVAVGHGVKVALDVDVIIEADRRTLPFGAGHRARRAAAFSLGASISSNSWRRVPPSWRIDAPSLSCASSRRSQR